MFKSQKDHCDVIEPKILAIFGNAKDYPEISFELFEYLDYFCEYFDTENFVKIKV